MSSGQLPSHSYLVFSISPHAKITSRHWCILSGKDYTSCSKYIRSFAKWQYIAENWIAPFYKALHHRQTGGVRHTQQATKRSRQYIKQDIHHFCSTAGAQVPWLQPPRSATRAANEKAASLLVIVPAGRNAASPHNCAAPGRAEAHFHEYCYFLYKQPRHTNILNRCLYVIEENIIKGSKSRPPGPCSVCFRRGRDQNVRIPAVSFQMDPKASAFRLPPPRRGLGRSALSLMRQPRAVSRGKAIPSKNTRIPAEAGKTPRPSKRLLAGAMET